MLLRAGLPGERVRARVTSTRGGARFGEVTALLERSPDRVRPDCGLHPRCGGCDLLDLAPAAHAEEKRALVLDALRRVGRLPEEALARVASAAAAPLYARARRRARLAVDDDGRLGFRRAKSREVVPLEEGCAALAPTLEEAALELTDEGELSPGASLQLACDDDGRVSLAVSHPVRAYARAMARRAHERGLVTGALALGTKGRVLDVFGDPVLHGEVAPGTLGGPYRSDAATFTQSTRFGGRRILEAVLEAARAGAPPLSEQRVLELFAGAGHLTLPLLAEGARVVAVEGDGRGFGWLERNVAMGGFSERAELRRGFIEGHSLPALIDGRMRFDAVVLDPPRTGVPGFRGLLEVIEAPRLVLVSCDLATGARDLGAALASGYALEHLLPIDAFPRTSHVEWVARLSR